MRYTKKDITLCISSIGKNYRSIKKILDQSLQQNVQVIVIVQFYKEYQVEWSNIESHYGNAVVIYDEGTGLSRSRNLALQNLKTELCYICDDDVILTGDFSEIVAEAHNKNEEEFLLFRIKDENGNDYKHYPKLECKYEIKDLAKVSSIEISFKTKGECSLRFDENFGLGTKLPTGEEYIFLVDNFRFGKKFKYLPFYTMLHPLESSSKNLTEELLSAKVAMMIRARGIAFGLVYYLYLATLKFNYTSKFSSGYFRSLFVMSRAVLRNGILKNDN